MIQELVDQLDSAMEQFHECAAHYEVAYTQKGSFDRTDDFPTLRVTLYMSEHYGKKVIEIQQRLDEFLRNNLEEHPAAIEQYTAAIIEGGEES